MAVNQAFKSFGKIVATIFGAVIVVIGAVIAVFASVPIGIAVAVGAVLAILWNWKDEIGSVINGVINFFKNLPNHISNFLDKAGNIIGKFVDRAANFFKGLASNAGKFIQNIVDYILKLPGKITSAATDLAKATMEIGKSIVNGVVDGIKSIGDSIADTFFDLLPGPLGEAIKGVSSFGGGLVSGIQDVLTPNDFILTSGGKMIQPDKRDTIIGAKPGGPIMDGASGGGQVTVNINDPVMKEDVDVQRVVDEVEDRVNRNTRGRSGGLT